MFEPHKPEDDLDEVLSSVRIEPDAAFERRLHARLRQSVEARSGEIAAARANHRRVRLARKSRRAPTQPDLSFGKEPVMRRMNWMIPVFSALVLGLLVIGFGALIILPNLPGDPAGTGADPTLTPLPTPEGQAQTPTATPITAADSSVCPAAQPGLAQYIHASGGYCFLYPEGWTVQEGTEFGGSPYDVLLVGPFHDLEHTQEGETAMVFVNLIAAPGAAVEITLPEYADAVVAQYPPDSGITRVDSELGGVPAMLLEHIPDIGMARNQFAVANGTLYSIELSATAGEVVQQDADQAWSLMVETLTFFAVPPAQVIMPDEVCPQATGDTQSIMDRWVGLCLILPVWAERHPDSLIFSFGPELTGMPEGLDPHAYIGIGQVGFAGGRTPAQAAQDYGGGTIQETTINGYPAAIVEDQGELLPYRVAYIVANDRVYSVLVSPNAPDSFPEATESIEQVWAMVLDTIAFFTPWN